jgi:hypothetical protein
MPYFISVSVPSNESPIDCIKRANQCSYNGRGKYERASERSAVCLADCLSEHGVSRQWHSGGTNQRNEGEARAHSAAAYERAILLWLRSYMFIHACTFFLAQPLASEWLRNVLCKKDVCFVAQNKAKHQHATKQM